MSERTEVLFDLVNMEDALRTKISILESEVLSLRVERDTVGRMNVTLQRRAEDYIDKAARLEAILNQVSMGLLAGINEMKVERERQRAERRLVREGLDETSGTFRSSYVVAGARTGRLDTYATHPKDRGLDVGSVDPARDRAAVPDNKWPQTDAPATPHIMSEAGR